MDVHKMFWIEFLEIYKSLPVLWKVKNENYCNRVAKMAACDKLVDKLKEIDPEANRKKAMKKINIFRTNYRRELKKKKLNEKSGAGADMFQSTLWYFDMLSFLADQESDRSNGVLDPPAKRMKIKEDEILEWAYNLLKNGNDANDATSVLAKSWVSQYAELANKQRVLARTIWSDVLYHGCMNRLTEKMVEDIHHILKDNTLQCSFATDQQRDEALLLPPIVHEQNVVLRQNSSIDLPSTSTTKSIPSRRIMNNEVIQKSSTNPRNVKEFFVFFSDDND